MLSNKQIRLLELLDKQVKNCRGCLLHNNGKSIPYWKSESKYAIISETPNYNEVRTKLPLMGAAGEILREQLGRVGFSSKDFLIINTVQFRAASGTGNGKPDEGQIITCQNYLRKYLKIVNPEKILCLGNYAKYIFTGNTQGVLRERGKFQHFKLNGSEVEYPVLFTINPAYCIYNMEEGTRILQQDIKLFKDSKFEKPMDWFLDESDFLII